MPRLDRFYDPSWVEANSLDWDVAHFHFGHEQHDIARVRAVIAAHRSRGVAVAFTVHDLQIPHLTDRRDEARDLLLQVHHDVNVLLTLTEGAGREVRDLTGRPCVVIPHGPLVWACHRAQLRRDRFVITEQPHNRPFLLWAGSVRPNLAWQETFAAYAQGGSPRRLIVSVRHSAAGPLVAAAADIPEIEICCHDDRPPHQLLEAALVACHALILPYRWGTHSGLLELAADIGVPVITTDSGYLAHQHPVRVVPAAADRVVDALAAALVQPLDEDLIVADHDRAEAGEAFLQSHRQLYENLMSGAPIMPSVGGKS